MRARIADTPSGRRGRLLAAPSRSVIHSRAVRSDYAVQSRILNRASDACPPVSCVEKTYAGVSSRHAAWDQHRRASYRVDRLDSSRPARKAFLRHHPTPDPIQQATSVAAATTTDHKKETLMLSNHTTNVSPLSGLAGMAKAFDDQQRQPTSRVDLMSSGSA